MIDHVSRRGVARAFGAVLLATGLFAAPLPASAQTKDPIKIGFSMALTGPLAANGKQALLGAKIWEEEVNAKGGLLGRPVQLVYYDDQSSPATVPGIYTKLLDVDKVDLVVGPYATNMVAPAIPVVMQKNKTFIGLFALDANGEFQYPKYFSMLPSGPTPKESFTEGFFQIAAAQNPKPQTIAPAAEDAGSHKNGDGDRSNAPASRHADEMGAEDHRDDDAEENGPVRRTKQVKKGKTDGAADERVHDAGVEGQKRGAEFRFGDDNDGDERPQRVGVMHALQNKPHDDATDQNTHGVLPTGRLDRHCGKALRFGSHRSPARQARIQ